MYRYCNAARHQVAYLLVYGDLPSANQLREWEDAVMRHSALPVDVEQVVMALPNGAHPMGTVLTAINALSTLHPEQNPAVAGQHIYKSVAVQVRLDSRRHHLISISTFSVILCIQPYASTQASSPPTQDKQIVRLIAKAPTIAAYAYHKLSGRMPSPPNQKLGYAENFLYMLDAASAPDYKPNPRLARALEVGPVLK